jgi:hypothetical protein
MNATAAKVDLTMLRNSPPVTGLAVAMMLGLAAAGSSTDAAEKFQKLNGGQIRVEIAGKEITDGVHWREFL